MVAADPEVAPVGAGGELEVLAAACGNDPSQVPRFVEPGDAVQYPLISVDGQDMIALFSSWWTPLHADSPYADQLEVPASQLLAKWPDGVALGLDLGTQHALQIPAADEERIREEVRAG